MSRIHSLSLLLANQIAAGEVIERPASVVKELIENALDAEATLIDIDIERSGSQLIRVHDNGMGIHPEDLPLALQRHTTSKIKALADLQQINSLGFRGEALASISAVSRFTITSARDNLEGWMVKTEGTLEPSIRQRASHPQGTTVEVRDLFFNTPARKKFLRTDKTEMDHIDEVVKRIALSAFGVEFILRQQQKILRHYRKTHSPVEEQQRLASLCGSHFSDNTLRIEAEIVGLRLWGWIIQPTFARSQPDLQYFYVNGRMVRDKLVSHAVKQAYHDVLYGDRYPAYVLFLEINPEEVDVNVHPTKHEVRFQESRLVHDFIARSIQNALCKPMNDVSQTMAPTKLAVKSSVASSKPAIPTLAANLEKSKISEQSSMNKNFSLPLNIQKKMTALHSLHAPMIQSVPVEAEIPLLGFALAQLKNIYILAENTQGLILVDMHAAHERILYEKLKTDFTKITTQPLLIPINIKFSIKESRILEEHSQELANYGMIITQLSQESWGGA